MANSNDIFEQLASDLPRDTRALEQDIILKAAQIEQRREEPASHGFFETSKRLSEKSRIARAAIIVGLFMFAVALTQFSAFETRDAVDTHSLTTNTLIDDNPATASETDVHLLLSDIMLMQDLVVLSEFQ